MSFHKITWFLVAAFACMLGGVAWSQVSTSRIEGTVVDTTNAVIASASVKVTNEDTGVSYDTRTASTGTYTVPSLTPGPYTVTVTHQGFETVTSKHNVLSIGAPLVVNLTLKVGATTETVEVQGAYERIETTNAAVSDARSSRVIALRRMPSRARARDACPRRRA